MDDMIGSVFHITSEDMSTTEGQNCYGTSEDILVPRALFLSLSRQGLGMRIEGPFDSRAMWTRMKRGLLNFGPRLQAVNRQVSMLLGDQGHTDCAHRPA